MLPLFEKEIKKGTGIPLLLLKRNILNPNDQMTEIIIDNIINTKSYDPRCEELRGDYLYEIVLNYENKEKIYSKITDIFEEMEENTYSENQIASFVINMVKDNLYPKEKYLKKIDWYIKHYRTQYVPGIDEIIEIDLINGIKHFAKIFGEIIVDEKEHNISEYLFFKEVNGFTKDELLKIMKGEKDYYIDAYFGFINRADQKKQIYKRPTVEEIISKYKSGKFYPLCGWIKKANEEDIKKLSDLYIGLKDIELKRKLLIAFSNTRIMVDENYLWKELKRTRNMSYKSAIIEALKNFEHDTVKILINDYYQSEETKIAALKAFVKYADIKDEGMLEYYFENLNVNEIHSITTYFIECETIKAFSFYKKILRYLYDKNPCSICRKEIIEAMFKANCLDENVLSEIEYDSDKDIRKIANDYKSKKHSA